MKKNTLIVLVLIVLATAAIAYAVAAQSESTPTPDPALEEFIPTEKLPADSAISFPVDI
jgi:hypothetical protein